MGIGIKAIIADRIFGILTEYGFDQDEELIDEIIEAVLDIFGVSEDGEVYQKWEGDSDEEQDG